jgi:hypothetical protein
VGFPINQSRAITGSPILIKQRGVTIAAPQIVIVSEAAQPGAERSKSAEAHLCPLPAIFQLHCKQRHFPNSTLG